MRSPRTLLIALWLAIAVSANAADTRNDFLWLIERPRVRLWPRVDARVTTNGLTQFHFTFTAEKGQRVPGVLVKQATSRGRRPVVVALHGTGGSKQNLLALCRKLATNGCIAVAIDGRYHGERIRFGKGTEAYNAAIARAWHEDGEHPFYYDTVWDVLRLLDYLCTRRDVDPKRIGLVGISKGGIETYLAAAVDPRIAVAVPIIGVQSFRWALENDQWQGRIKTIQSAFDSVAADAGVASATSEFVARFYDRVVPGIYGQFDGPAMLPLISPRPLLVINSDSDPNTPLPGVKVAADLAAKAYEQANAGERFGLLIQKDTAHRVLPESERAAIEWLIRWLRP